jgi:hypothetical protein
MWLVSLQTLIDDCFKYKALYLEEKRQKEELLRIISNMVSQIPPLWDSPE